MLRAKTFVRFIVLPIIVAALSSMPCGAWADESLEHTVEAAFLYKFGRFVEWPATAFVSPTSPFNLCIVGDDPFGPTLDKVVEGEMINGRNIAVHRLKNVGPDSGCHILYIGNSGTQGVAQIIKKISGSSILTVSKTGESEPDAAIIDFVISDNRVRFDIDEEAAAQNNLVISSRLLKLALNVKQRAARDTR